MKKINEHRLFKNLGSSDGVTAMIQGDTSLPQVAFAAEKVKEVLNDADNTVIFKIKANAAIPEAFTIKKNKSGAIQIVGTDAAGAMYGGLEVAELIRIGGVKNVKADEQRPYMEMRGVKFNIPLDVRTPSYSDMGDAGQFNIPHVWDYDFWTAFIDEVAIHRYNYISLWNLHPFPSVVKVPDYPEVALANVKRAVRLEKKPYSNRGWNYDAEEILDETETLLTISIEEKIAFWQKVMKYGKNRNVDFYFVTWNIFVYGTAGKYGIDDDINNPVTVDYFRKSVRQLFQTYPDLKGIGITTGENMHDSSNQEKEDWAFKTYGLGVLDAAEEFPNRTITFLHRQHETGAAAIAETFKPLLDQPNVDFIFSYKYAMAHAYSSTKQQFHRDFTKQIEGCNNLKTIWTMRNDSTYLFRWAAPKFMQEFVRNIPMEMTRGYYFGSDGWVWGREHIHKDAKGSCDLEIKTHWCQWMLWGRLAYNPTISTLRFTAITQARFPNVNAGKLMEAWQKASLVFPLVTGYHWGQLDYLWYPEACIGFADFAKTKTGFHDVNRFITLEVHPNSGYISIPDYVKTFKQGKTHTGIGPFEVVNEFHSNADDALSIISALDECTNKELVETLKDIKAMAYLSRYYGYKILGATHLQLYRETNTEIDQTKAVEALEKAAEVWRIYAESITIRFTHPMWLNRMQSNTPTDYTEITKWVVDDIKIAKNNILE